MQVVTAIIGRQQAARLLRVARNCVKVHYGIEVTRCTNPLIDR
jgi:hypothetical protein